MKNKIGRNDKCYCGSGKKYKHCHLNLDEHHPLAPPAAQVPHFPLLPPGSDVRKMNQMIRSLAASAPKRERAQLEKMLAQTAPILEYMEHKDSIEAASTALESYRDEFIELAENKEAYLARARDLFDEEAFVPLRFTAPDVRKAFEAVGYVPSALMDEKSGEKIRAALLHLANSDRRRELSLALLAHLPEYVAAGRHMDAWLIQSLANDTVEFEKESNPFLFQMFAFGYDALMQEQRAVDEAILRDVGIDLSRLQHSSIQEIETWVQALASDPAVQAKMEAAMKAHPEAQALSIAQLQHLERQSASLLEGKDAGGFLLENGEVEPWLSLMLERWNSEIKSRRKNANEALSKNTSEKIFGKVAPPLVQEMVRSVFTPERIRDLISKLRVFRDEKFTAGDKAAATKAFGAITSLEREKEPECNFFLNAVCFLSLRKLIDHAVQSGQPAGQVAPADEPST